MQTTKIFMLNWKINRFCSFIQLFKKTISGTHSHTSTEFGFSLFHRLHSMIYFSSARLFNPQIFCLSFFPIPFIYLVYLFCHEIVSYDDESSTQPPCDTFLVVKHIFFSSQSNDVEVSLSLNNSVTNNCEIQWFLTFVINVSEHELCNTFLFIYFFC